MCRVKARVTETVKKEGYPVTFDGEVNCPNKKERYTSHFSNSVGDSFIAVSIIGDSGFAEYGIMGDSIMAVSIIGDSGSVFLPLYTKFRYSKVSAPGATLAITRSASVAEVPPSICLSSLVLVKKEEDLLNFLRNCPEYSE
jgi:hypothetical protein